MNTLFNFIKDDSPYEWIVLSFPFTLFTPLVPYYPNMFVNPNGACKTKINK
jgi:hypothetical protein